MKELERNLNLFMKSLSYVGIIILTIIFVFGCTPTTLQPIPTLDITESYQLEEGIGVGVEIEY